LRPARLAALAAALLGLVAVPAGAEIRSVEAVGAAPLYADRPATQAPRDVALQRGLAEAVRQVALDELTEFDPVGGDEALAAALGDEPLDYVTRFRILEDRGERPALFTEDAEATREYVVMAEVHVDVERVRNRLVRAGLVGPPSGEGERRRVRLVLEDLGDYAALQAVRALLLDLGARSALPLELERGRAVLEVEARRSPRELLLDLQRAAPPELLLFPLGSDDDSARLRARLRDAPAADAAAIDTTNPNRY
jgi:hypothetical protein